MRKRWIRLIALLLGVVLLFCGCALQPAPGYGDPVPYGSMEYSRPDITGIRSALDAAIHTGQTEETDVEAVANAIYAFYDAYDWFYTHYYLADIRYCGDLTDIYWEKEYNYCADNAPAVEAMLEELYYALAKAPLREALEAEEYFGADFFDSYEGENQWDEAFTALMEEENALEAKYYALSAQITEETADYDQAVTEQLVELLVELIGLRQAIAAYWGYEDYVQFAGDFYHYRDYTPAEMAAYLEQVREELVAQYMNIREEDFAGIQTGCTELETFRFVRNAAKNMGGTIWEAFQLMENAKLYDITYGENKYAASFEVYLPGYWEPFVFMNPSLTRYDCLVLAHEFGHFANDYACYGTYAGVDVVEFYSQGMEYLSLCYGENTDGLTRAKLADSLCVYVEQSAFAAFEQQMYALTGEELSADGLCRLYEKVARDYGFENYDMREFVEIPHFYTEPLYVFSYVVSNDAAMQLYQMEQTQPGSGLALMEENLDVQVYYFGEFLDCTGLESPFAPGRIQKVRETFAREFGR